MWSRSWRLISPVFWVWNDVRAILLLQVVFVAVGAWLLFELALSPTGDAACLQMSGRRVWLAEPVRSLAGLVALALAVAYLLDAAVAVGGTDGVSRNSVGDAL